MTKDDILSISAEQGMKITHELFTDDEYIEVLTNGDIRTEEGYIVSQDEFWRYRTEKYWDEGWSIYQESI